MIQEINILLNKYFQAKTTLEEENELKRYFASDEVLAEHEMYRELFDALAEEAEIVIHPKKLKIPVEKSKKHALKFIFYPGIAAIVLLCIFILSKEADNSYVRINGKKIKQQEFVEQYASMKLKKINVLLSGSLNPLDNLYKIKKSTEIGSETLEDVKEKIYNIYENLPIKIIKNEKDDDPSRMPNTGSSDIESTNA